MNVEKAPTIYDITKQFGISTTTVSQTLMDSTSVKKADKKIHYDGSQAGGKEFLFKKLT